MEIDHEIISTANLLPSTDSRRVEVSYKRKYVHKELVNCLVKFAQENSVIRWTDPPDRTIAVDWEVKNQTKQKPWYSKTCVKRPPKKTTNWFSRPVIAWEHSAILSTFMKLPFVIKIFILSILSGRFTQVLLYKQKHILAIHNILVLLLFKAACAAIQWGLMLKLWPEHTSTSLANTLRVWGRKQACLCLPCESLICHTYCKFENIC